MTRTRDTKTIFFNKNETNNFDFIIDCEKYYKQSDKDSNNIDMKTIRYLSNFNR